MLLQTPRLAGRFQQYERICGMAWGAAEFDTWYADRIGSPRADAMVRAALGLPEGIESNSLLPWNGIAELAAELRLVPGQVLADLGCGRGGYGMEVARRTGARLAGLDFSLVAVRAAADAAARSALGGRAGFFAGDFGAVGLRDGAADAVLCVDAIQLAVPPLAALAEFRRILRPGGRVALTAWQVTDRDDERISERLRRLDLAGDLAAAGFREVKVTGKPAWARAERALWRAAVAADGDGDPAFRALRVEASRILKTFGLRRRVCATATR